MVIKPRKLNYSIKNMKKLIYLLTVLFATSSVIAQEIKTIEIYNNGITHTNIKANITYVDGKIKEENVFYTVTSAAMWTGKLSSIVVYNGNIAQMADFLRVVFQFAQANKDNIGATITIEGRHVSMAKVMGIKCITIKTGDESVNTNLSSVSKALEALNKWMQKNYTPEEKK